MRLGSAKAKRGDWLLEASTLKGQIIVIGIHMYRSHSVIRIFYTEKDAASYIADLTTSKV